MFDPRVLKAMTVTVSCGLRNFEEGGWSNRTSKEVVDHIPDVIPAGYLADNKEYG